MADDAALCAGEAKTGRASAVEAARTAYVQVLHAGLNPRIEHFVAPRTGAEYAYLLSLLLGEEIDYRRSAGERPERVEYPGRFPGQASVVGKVVPEAVDPASVGSAD
jgi:hypothetical protein